MKSPLNRMINRAARRAVRREKHKFRRFCMKVLIVAMIASSWNSSKNSEQKDAAALEFQMEETKSATDIANEAKDELLGVVNGLLSSCDYSTEEGVEKLADEIYDAAEKFADENGVEFSRASLTRVVDGDTIVVDICGDDCGEASHRYTVRLIGVNTPESVASEEYLEKKGTTNSEEGKAASDHTKEILEGVKDLYLQSDVSDTDKYGRLLRYVWLEVPDDAYDIDEVTNKMLNAMLVRDGTAECAVYKPDTEYADYFAAIERGTTDDFEVDR